MSARCAWSSIPSIAAVASGAGWPAAPWSRQWTSGSRSSMVEVISDQTALIGMFRALGFEPEALLADHVRDRAGEVRDLMVLSNDVESQFSSMAAAGISESSSRRPA